jgi:hypothetical protein
MRVQDIKTKSPFNELFAIDENILNSISENIRLKGFDVSQPIVIWDGKGIVIDGHTRLAAAKKAGVSNIITCSKPFADEQSALAYAIHNQRNRRNLTQAEIQQCIEKVDQLKERGGDHGNQFTGGKVAKASGDANGKSAKQTAAIVGVSQATVERSRTVSSDPEVAQAVKAGKMSINKGAQTVKAKRNPAPPTEPITSESDKRQDALLSLWEQIIVWRKTASQYPEFKEIVWAIDAAKEKRSK